MNKLTCLIYPLAIYYYMVLNALYPGYEYTKVKLPTVKDKNIYLGMQVSKKCAVRIYLKNPNMQ